jgi:hypothetical protein
MIVCAGIGESPKKSKENTAVLAAVTTFDKLALIAVHEPAANTTHAADSFLFYLGSLKTV